MVGPERFASREIGLDVAVRARHALAPASQSGISFKATPNGKTSGLDRTSSTSGWYGRRL
jgi:hypothetical protein